MLDYLKLTSYSDTKVVIRSCLLAPGHPNASIDWSAFLGLKIFKLHPHEKPQLDNKTLRWFNSDVIQYCFQEALYHLGMANHPINHGWNHVNFG